MKLEKEEEREGEMIRRKVVIRFPIDPMSEALVEVNQAIKASAELVAKETAIERVPVVEEEAKVDKEDEGQTRELRGQSSFVPGLFQKTFDTSSYLLKWSREPAESELLGLDPDNLVVDTDLAEGHSLLVDIEEEEERQVNELQEEETEGEVGEDEGEASNEEEEPRYSRRGRRIKRPERLLL